jgi:hypothetical protein
MLLSSENKSENYFKNAKKILTPPTKQVNAINTEVAGIDG